MLTYTCSCFVDAAVHKGEPWHNKLGLTWDMQLPWTHQPVPFSAPLPTRGTGNPPAEFDSHKASNKGLSLAHLLPTLDISDTFFIKLGKSRRCEMGESKPVRKEIMFKLLNKACSLKIFFLLLF